MIVAIAAAVVATTSVPKTSLGPIFSGESVAAVRRLLGKGTPYSICRPDPELKPGDCPLALKYADGKNVLKLSFGGDPDGVYTIEVDLGASQSGVAVSHVRTGAFANWTWQRRRIDRLPTAAIAGWEGAIEKPERDCFVQFKGPTQPTGAELVASYGCAAGSTRVATFMTGFLDP